MSIHQLKEIYAHVNLEFSLDSEKLLELKKIILLHLKSSPSSSLTINGRTYTKNDFLQLFDKEYTEDTFDIQIFITNHHSLNLLLTPAKIDSSFIGEIKELEANEHWFTIQNFFTENHFMEYYQSIRSDIKARRLLIAEQKLSFLFVFEDDAQLRLKKSIKAEIKVMLDESTTPKKMGFVHWSSYFEILKYVANDDEDFLLHQYNIIIKMLGKFSYEQISQFFTRQLKLGFSEYVKMQLREEQKKFASRNSYSSSSGSSSSDSNAGKIALYVIIVIIKFVIISRSCSSRSTPSFNRHDIPFRQNEYYRQNYGTDDDDSLDSLVMKVRQRNLERNGNVDDPTEEDIIIEYPSEGSY